MIVECSRRQDGWILVKGNEEEISDFLLKQDYNLRRKNEYYK